VRERRAWSPVQSIYEQLAGSAPSLASRSTASRSTGRLTPATVQTFASRTPTVPCYLLNSAAHSPLTPAPPSRCLLRLARQALMLDIPRGLDRVQEMRRLLDLKAVVILGIVRIPMDR